MNRGLPPIQCKPGTYSTESSRTCTPCLAGTTSDTYDAPFCPTCPAGTYSSLTSGATYCTQCPRGTYSYEGASTCPEIVSYFNNYQSKPYGLDGAAPYVLNFKGDKVSNGGTEYFIGDFGEPTAKYNVFSIPIVDGSGQSCQAGIYRRGQLILTCGAAFTIFAVTENPQCNYQIFYSTTQQCPPGTTFAPPPPPSPSPPWPPYPPMPQNATSPGTCPTYSYADGSQKNTYDQYGYITNIYTQKCIAVASRWARANSEPPLVTQVSHSHGCPS